MSDSFNECRDTEAASLALVVPVIESLFCDGPLVMFDNFHNRDTELSVQRLCGDAVAVSRKSGKKVTLEFKAESKSDTGNLFIETWSNLSQKNPGWLIKCKADYLVYHIIANRVAYVIDMRRLERWALGIGRVEPLDGMRSPGNIYERSVERRQNKKRQANDTWGRCVPIATLKSEGIIVSTITVPVERRLDVA